MLYFAVLLGIYLLSVAALAVIARFRPDRLHRLHAFLWVGVFSFVPAIALAREILLSANSSTFITMVPTWMTGGTAALAVIAAISIRKWIQSRILDRTAQAARQFLDELPKRVMRIEADVTRGVTALDDADRRKLRLQREMDRVAAIDGVARFLYLLLKIHFVRLGLQGLGAVAVDAWSEAGIGWYTLDVCSTMVIIEGACILGPHLLLMTALIALFRGSALQFQDC